MWLDKDNFDAEGRQKRKLEDCRREAEEEMSVGRAKEGEEV